jgi:hypothetical protein
MQSGIESVVKLVLVASLVLAGLAVWIVPKMGWLRHRQVGERLFIATQVVGMLCGVVGLVVIFAWPQQALESHLWELMVLPYALVYFYWIIIMRRARRLDVVDEKQGLNMATAGGVTVGLGIFAMFVAFVLHDRGIFDARLFYPYFLLVTILILSATTLLFFKRG